jgi:hypothetical protein
MIQIIQSLLLTFLMEFFEPCSTMPDWHAWLYAIATIIATLLSNVITHQVFYLILMILYVILF